MRDIRKLATARGVEPQVAPYAADGLTFQPHPVVHTSHPTFGYLMRVEKTRVVWHRCRASASVRGVGNRGTDLLRHDESIVTKQCAGRCDV
jgi:hypothetical protein